MKLWLKENGAWKLFENVTADDLKNRHITISPTASVGEGASVGDRASVGAWARVGDRARVKKTTDCVVLGPIGSRNAMITGYKHKGKLFVGTGCFIGSATDFEKKVKERHGENEHAKQYTLALKYLRERFGR